MRTIVLPLGALVLAAGLSGCVPTASAPVMDQAGASCFVDGDSAVLMLPVRVGGDLGLTELALLDADGLDLVGYTAIEGDDVPFSTSEPPTDDDVDAMQPPGPADPALELSAGTPYWLVAVFGTGGGGGSASGFRLEWDDETTQDARVSVEVGSTCSM